MEIWKNIKGFEGYYQVSDQGNIKSLNRNIKRKKKGILNIKEKILSKRLNSSGYNTVWLCKDGKEYNKKVSRLVALNFIPNLQDKPHVNHIDGIKTNDCVVNLEWCSPSENEKHAHMIGLKNHKLENNPHTKLKNKDVLEIRRLYSCNVKQKEIADKYKIDQSTVSKIVNFHNFKGLK